MMEEGVREKVEVPQCPKEDQESGAGVRTGQGRKKTRKDARGLKGCQGRIPSGKTGRRELEGGAERQEARRLRAASSLIFLFS